jgi:subtilisin
MAKKRGAARAAAEQAGSGESAHRQGLIENLVRAGLTDGTTGRYLVVYQPGEAEAGVRAMRDLAGLETISTADFSEGVVPHEDVDGEQILLANLGIGITSADPDQLERVSLASADSPIQLIVPERVVLLSTGLPGVALPGMPGFPMPGYPGAGGGWSLDYLRGYHDALSLLLQAYGPGGGFPPFAAPPVTVPAFPFPSPPGSFAPPAGQVPLVPSDQPSAAPNLAGFDETAATWGLQACNVVGSQLSGAGVNVAVLDTGLDLQHPDFQDGRVVQTKSFVGQPVQDVPTPADPLGRPGNPGHGTHCIGTACGPKEPGSGPRYGIAYGAAIFVGKVLLNNGSGTTGTIVEGISWAIAQKCKVVSLSLGGPANGPNPDPVYEAIGKRAVRQGTLILAAAGNRSRRSQRVFAAVDSPANATAILAVGAVDRNMQIANFSNRGLFPPGGAVDVVGPGVDIYSSLPGPKNHGRLAGTSMATPHAAGIAALIAEGQPDWDPLRIGKHLEEAARNLSLDPRDVGNGLVQA